MAEYKLTYYNSQGLAEPIRYLFALKEIPFDDVKVPEEDQYGIFLRPEYHQSEPYHIIPAIEFDGKTLTQSTSILRFLGRKYGLCGNDEFEAALCDKHIETTRDFVAYFQKAFEENDPHKKAQLCQELGDSIAVCYMGIIDEFVVANGGRNYIVGNKLSIADIYFCHVVTVISKIFPEPIYKSFPRLEQLVDNFFAIPEIQEYISKRNN